MSLPLRRVLWYWAKYVLLFAFIPIILLIYSLTYYLPQLPRAIDENFPNAVIAFKDNTLSVNPPQQYTWGNPEFSLSLDTRDIPQDFSGTTTGILLLPRGIVIKSPHGETRTFPYPILPDFSLTKDGLKSFISTNQFMIWTVLVAGLLFLGLIGALVYVIFKLGSMILWALGFVIAGKVLHRPLTLPGAFNLVIYSSILPLLLTAVMAVAPGDFLYYLSLGLFLYFAATWFWYLPSSATK